MPTQLKSLILGLWAALITACQSAPELGPIDLTGTWQAAFAHSPAPPTSLGLGTKTYREGGALLEVGDRLVFEFQIQTGADFTRRYAIIEDIGPALEIDPNQSDEDHASLSAAPSAATKRRILLRLFNHAGKQIRQATTDVGESVGFGQLLACNLATERTDENDFNADPEVKRSLESLLEFTGLIRSNNLIAHMFEDATRIPSLLSVALSMGVHIGLDPQYRTSMLLPSGRHLMGMQMSINEAPALNFEFLIGAPIPPLTLTSGVLGFQASHPTNPANFVRALLIGMSSGPQTVH